MTRLGWFCLFVGVAAIIVWVVSAAKAQNMQCMPHDLMTEAMKGKGHTQQVQAVTEDGWVLEIFATEDGTAWALVLTKSPTVSCLIDVGTAWEVTVQKPSY
jgi:hypothetical protein